MRTVPGMKALPVTRERPPSRLEYRDEERHLVLRPWSPMDTDALLDAVEASRAALREYMPWAHVAMTRAQEADLLARFASEYLLGRDYVFGLFDAQGAVLGGLGLHPRVPLNPRGLEVGYWCHSKHAGKGHTTAATRALIVLAFEHFGCDRLQVMHNERNAASRRVVQKCGFVPEGVLRRATAAVKPELLAAGYDDAERHPLYALLPADLAGLEWYERVKAGLAVYDAAGTRVG